MAHIYIALVDTPGVLAYLIRRFLGEKYIHVVIAMDEELTEAYSFGRRNPRVPFFAGFERERAERILRAFPTAEYMVCELTCGGEQKEEICRRLREDYRRRLHFHYAVLGLLAVARGVPFYQRNHYTCSSYIARILAEQRIVIVDKHFSLVTPNDFYRYNDKKVLFEGRLAEFLGAADRRREARESAGETTPGKPGKESPRERWAGWRRSAGNAAVRRNGAGMAGRQRERMAEAYGR